MPVTYPWQNVPAPSNSAERRKAARDEKRKRRR